VANERETEQERLDRIEKLLKQLADASGQLQEELKISRELAAARARATATHTNPAPKPTPTQMKKNKRR
jgi:hypothetical protein